jgi:hypothetical protein
VVFGYKGVLNYKKHGSQGVVPFVSSSIFTLIELRG